jgi:hypothetical protein
VPVFPVKKSPSFVKAVKRLSIVEKSNFLNQSSSKKSQFSSTQENSDQSKNNVKLPLPYATKSVLLFDFSKTPENSNADKQILCLIYQFKNKPEGIAKRELECTIIKNLIN